MHTASQTPRIKFIMKVAANEKEKEYVHLWFVVLAVLCSQMLWLAVLWGKYE